jgi:hypothetical protein
MSCPYTSPQNGKAERILHTINNMIRSLLFQASMSARYWVEELHTATYLLNRLPCKANSISCSCVALYSVAPSYEHLRVFGCVCYPNLSTDHKGYQCLDLSTNNIVISRHIIFDEAVFPFTISPRLTNNLDIFL